MVEQLIGQILLDQQPFIFPDGVGIGHWVFKGQLQESTERQTIQYLVLNLLERQVVVVAQKNHFEHQQCVGSRPTFIGCGWHTNLAEGRPEGDPVNEFIDFSQWIVVLIQAVIQIVEIKETGCMYQSSERMC